MFIVKLLLLFIVIISFIVIVKCCVNAWHGPACETDRLLTSQSEHTWKLAKKTAVQEEWLGDIEEEQNKTFSK